MEPRPPETAGEWEEVRKLQQEIGPEKLAELDDAIEASIKYAMGANRRAGEIVEARFIDMVEKAVGYWNHMKHYLGEGIVDPAAILKARDALAHMRAVVVIMDNECKYVSEKQPSLRLCSKQYRDYAVQVYEEAEKFLDEFDVKRSTMAPKQHKGKSAGKAPRNSKTFQNWKYFTYNPERHTGSGMPDDS